MRVGLILAALLVVDSAGFAQDRVDYARDIKPILATKCGACHSALKQESGLRLDAGKFILKGSDNGPVVKANAADSPIINRVLSDDDDERMPPEEAGEALTEKQVQLLKSWIESGARFPDDEEVLESPLDHWAYQKPARRDLPVETTKSTSINPIDAFVLARQAEKRLTSSKRADPNRLLRRAYLDLIGLPPTREQLEAFESDPSQERWEQVVDDLLSSKSYGERWGRHWMDVWRYSDWDGYKNELRGSQKHIWRWRDWIIESLNADKGYDQMVVEMLAADELYPNDSKALAATGFLARNFHKSNRDIWLDATVEHTSKAFLGITMNCARCHDHKYDPIPQESYYAFRAIFEPHHVRMDRVGAAIDTNKNGLPRVFDENPDAQTFLYFGGNEKQPDKENPIAPATPKFLGVPMRISPVELPVESYYPDLNDSVVAIRLEKLQATVTKAKQELEKLTTPTKDAESTTPDANTTRLKTLEHELARLAIVSYQNRWSAERATHHDFDKTLVEQLAKIAAGAENEFKIKTEELGVFKDELAVQKANASGEEDPKKKKTIVAGAEKRLSASQAKLKTALADQAKNTPKYSPLGKVYPKTSTGRRTAFARWVVDPNNPLAARVCVNQIWMRHFGDPLVDNVFDFGMQSRRPIHSDLLDWLAVELVENNWSTKHIHQLILNSKTWQQDSSSVNKRNQKVDPDNRYLWRMKSRRLDAEVIRDNVLAISNQLDRTMFGPEIDFRQDETSKRRSIYLRHAYEKQSTLLGTFDAANPADCYRRSESVIPQQALALFNSSLCLEQSRKLATRLWDEAGTQQNPTREFVDSSFLHVLARFPGDNERRECMEFLDRQAKLLSNPEKLEGVSGEEKTKLKSSSDPVARARENLVLVLFNHNDFVTVR